MNVLWGAGSSFEAFASKSCCFNHLCKVLCCRTSAFALQSEYYFSSTGYTLFKSARDVLSKGRALVLVLFPRTHGADGE